MLGVLEAREGWPRQPQRCMHRRVPLVPVVADARSAGRASSALPHDMGCGGVQRETRCGVIRWRGLRCAFGRQWQRVAGAKRSPVHVLVAIAWSQRLS